MEVNRKTVFITVKLSTWKGVGSGWVGLFSRTRKLNKTHQIATDASVTHSSKEEAWQSIEDRVEQIDFDKTDVYFNESKVTDLTSIKAKLSDA